MPVQTLPATAEEFDVWVMLPENAGRDYEFVAGEVREVVSNNYSSRIAMNIGIKIGVYLETNDIGWTTGADGGYWIAGERYIPDLAFTRYERLAEAPTVAYNSVPPDLVGEVLSPTNDESDMTVKVANYLSEDCVVWLVDPEKSEVNVIISGQAVKKLSLTDTLDGGAVLPGFSLAVSAIFPQSTE